MRQQQVGIGKFCLALQDYTELMRCRYVLASLKDRNWGLEICQMTLAERWRTIDLIAIAAGCAGYVESSMYRISGDKGPFAHETKIPMYFEPG